SPNRPEWGRILATDAAALAAIVRAVRPRVRLPLWVKLSPNVGDVTAIGRAAEGEGADALSAINTLRALAIDLERRAPSLAIGPVLAGFLEGVLGIRLFGVRGAVAERPLVLERRLATLGVGLELHLERRLPVLGLGVSPGEERRGLLALSRRGGRRAASRG